MEDCEVSLDSEYVYHDCMRILYDIKLSQGPLCVSATLKKRPSIAKFILQHQTDVLVDLEDKIKLLTVSS